MTSYRRLRQRSRTWAWQALQGVLLILLGLLAERYPFASSFAAGLYVAWALIVTGVVGLITALRTGRMRGHGLDAVLGIVSLAAGAAALAHPFWGVLAMLWAIGAWLAVCGAAKLIAGRKIRRERVELMATGIIDLVLAAIFFTGLATADLLLAAMVAGISLIVAGLVSLSLAWRLRGIARHKPRVVSIA